MFLSISAQSACAQGCPRLCHVKKLFYIEQSSTLGRVFTHQVLRTKAFSSMRTIAFFDLEVNPSSKTIQDIGAVLSDDRKYRGSSLKEFQRFIKDSEFIAGHNVLNHDLPWLHKVLGDTVFGQNNTIDTLCLSPLLFPSKPYHRLVKDEKLQTGEINNPLNDSIKARDLFNDQVAAFHKLSLQLKYVYYGLLHADRGFNCFFEYLDFQVQLSHSQLVDLIRKSFEEKICDHVDLSAIVVSNPVALGYALALINSTNEYSITPPWVLHKHKEIDNVLRRLRAQPCIVGCGYCHKALDPHLALNHFFGFDYFRNYEGEPLQEKAVQAAINGDSLLAIFPTGGGKSITFQLPALMDGRNTKSLTVVISPLQSLMKDQVDNLEDKGITNVAAINGMLDPIERSKAIERVQDGSVHLLYISPESLRSNTIEKLFLGRKISRFVIDEAHCFSAWGQEFRVDYLYIGDFIRNLQIKKGLDERIPVSCFTATAKLKVIEDIREYFKTKLSLDLKMYRSGAARTNLKYNVFSSESEEQKYAEVRRLIEFKDVSTIIYISRTKTAVKIAEKLVNDGFSAAPFHGKMEAVEKIRVQNDFMKGDVNIIVATSAFGMGVDKSDVGMVIHYEISDSLENYVQEAGRAGRDEKLTAECHVLFNEEDLNKHFLLLSQTKLDIKEINQVWKAIRNLSKTRDKVSASALEIARAAGWDESIRDVETRVKAAIAALENAKYVQRGNNLPSVFADSILSKTAQEAIDKIDASKNIPEKLKVNAGRIIKKLISSKRKAELSDDQAEARIDYIADQLGIHRRDVMEIIQLLREDGILADAKDLTAFMRRNHQGLPLKIFEKYRQMENFFADFFDEAEQCFNMKLLNEKAGEFSNGDVSVQSVKTLLNFWTIKGWIKKSNAGYARSHVNISLCSEKNAFKEKLVARHEVDKLIIEYLVSKAAEKKSQAEDVLIEFSLGELKEALSRTGSLFEINNSVDNIEDSLFFLSRIGAIKIEGGFLVLYNRLTIEKLETNNQVRYKQDDYRQLKEFYQNKVEQIHIVGEYARRMTQNYEDALRFVDDYFNLNYAVFLSKYFPGRRKEDIRRTMTPEKFRQLFGSLSVSQLQIVTSSEQYMVVAAGPGSGKTRILVHKLASLLMAEDIRHEQLLMLTFSRAAATEFKKRLLNLIGSAAYFVEIKTFHSYCFDLLGKIGNLSDSQAVVSLAIGKIRSGEIELSQITKAVLVIDEAQDMSATEYELVKTLIDHNEDMRVIMVGDDDQNIYGFRGSDSAYMVNLPLRSKAIYELSENYRSKSNLVEFTNQWIATLPNRLKKLPIVGVDKSPGIIDVTEHSSAKLVVPVSMAVVAAELSGTTCILTRTNDEAATIAGVLMNQGIQAQLIQSKDGFPLSDLLELRWFSNELEKVIAGPVISEEDWNIVKIKFTERFNTSTLTAACLSMLETFESVNPGRKYKSDWKSFLIESKFEDFVKVRSEVVFVSTIHKSKGKEFDNVFLLLSRDNHTEPDVIREIYVGMTRAKQRLLIHYHGHYLSRIQGPEVSYRVDGQEYPSPNHISIAMGLKDVQLSYFGFIQNRVQKLSSGDLLQFRPTEMLDMSGNRVLKFSQAFIQKISPYLTSYVASETRVSYIVHWKNEEEQDLRVVLPVITLARREG